MRSRPVTSPPRGVPAGQLRRSLAAVQRFRLNVVFGALLLLFAGLLGRLAKLQLVDAHAYGAEASRRHESQHAFRGLRGRILDRHGRTLVTSRCVLSVAVDPAEVRDVGAFSRRLAMLLDAVDEAPRIRRTILEAPAGCRHRCLYASVEDERVVAQLALLRDFASTVRAGLRGLKVEEHERRTYPNGHYAAHVLGRAPREENGTAAGGHGVEGAFHDELKGERMLVPVQRDGGRGRRYRAALAMDPNRAAGQDVHLTLDIVVQHALETALDELDLTWSPTCAAGVVLDPRTGHVLALANRPTFHPARAPGGYNHVVQGRFPPGSLFKPFTAAFALGRGVVGVDERIELPERKPFRWRRHTRWVSDAHPNAEADGRGTVAHVLAASSNPGAAELLWRVMAAPGSEAAGADRSTKPVRELVARLGFDRPTGIELHGDKPALYDGSQGPWNPLYPALGFAFGQGLAVSPLRLAACFAAFARPDARIVRATLLPGGGGPRWDLPPVCATREHLAVVRDGLRRCVLEGTAQKAFDGCAYPVAGKTGTAELPGTDWQVAGFAGYAPADRPCVLVLIVARVDKRIVHPTTGVRPYGGNVAGPAVRAVIEESLAYRTGWTGADGCEERR